MPDEYLYDPDGNLLQDLNAGFTLAYNHLNKPVEIGETATGNTLKITYSADGAKLRQTTYQTGSAPQTLDYSTGYIYKGRALLYLAHEEGRCLRLNASGNNGGAHGPVHSFRFEYNLQDHLGNLRVSFTDSDQDGKPEITQEQHYEAYGLRLGGLTYMGGEEERYAYSGKERIGELGLGWTDFGARMYNPTIGRWNGVDALGEKYASFTPYNYVFGNTILVVDADGNDTTFADNAIKGVITNLTTERYYIHEYGYIANPHFEPALARIVSAAASNPNINLKFTSNPADLGRAIPASAQGSLVYLGASTINDRNYDRAYVLYAMASGYSPEFGTHPVAEEIAHYDGYQNQGVVGQMFQNPAGNWVLSYDNAVNEEARAKHWVANNLLHIKPFTTEQFQQKIPGYENPYYEVPTQFAYYQSKGFSQSDIRRFITAPLKTTPHNAPIKAFNVQSQQWETLPIEKFSMPVGINGQAEY